MSTVIQVEPELSSQAEAIFKQLGTSISEATDTFLRYVVARKKLPEVLNELPIPCIDDMTAEELDALVCKAFDEIEAGDCYTPEEARKILEEDDGEF